MFDSARLGFNPEGWHDARNGVRSVDGDCGGASHD
jgi:hypothetical protein